MGGATSAQPATAQPLNTAPDSRAAVAQVAAVAAAGAADRKYFVASMEGPFPVERAFPSVACAHEFCKRIH
jgi:hypothetical protein